MEVRPPADPALWMARASIILGWAMILSGIGLFGWDCLLWLRDGVWSHSSLADLWGRAPPDGGEPSPAWAEMRGLHYLVARVLHWFGRFPISLALVVLGVVAAWTGNGLHDRAEAAMARRFRAR